MGRDELGMIETYGSMTARRIINEADKTYRKEDALNFLISVKTVIDREIIERGCPHGHLFGKESGIYQDCGKSKLCDRDRQTRCFKGGETDGS